MSCCLTFGSSRQSLKTVTVSAGISSSAVSNPFRESLQNKAAAVAAAVSATAAAAVRGRNSKTTKISSRDSRERGRNQKFVTNRAGKNPSHPRTWYYNGCKTRKDAFLLRKHLRCGAMHEMSTAPRLPPTPLISSPPVPTPPPLPSSYPPPPPHLRLNHASWRSKTDSHSRCASAFSLGPLPSPVASAAKKSPALRAASTTAAVAVRWRITNAAQSLSLLTSFPPQAKARAVWDTQRLVYSGGYVAAFPRGNTKGEERGARGGGRGGVYSVCAWPQLYDLRPSHSYDAGTEHVGFSPTRQTLLAPSTKRREVFGESHEG